MFVLFFVARSAVFEAESEGESEKSEDLQEGSCPVLNDDNETERVSVYIVGHTRIIKKNKLLQLVMTDMNNVYRL